MKRLPHFFAARWIVKDLAQFMYSTRLHDITDDQKRRWLDLYCRRAGRTDVETLRRQIDRKVAWIARHDIRLNRNQPGRNISIPTQSPNAAK